MEKFYKKIVALTVLITGLTYNSLYAQIATWQVFDLTGTSTERSVNVSIADQYLDVSPVSLGDGLDAVGLMGTFCSRPKTSNTNITRAGIDVAIANNDYYGFNITAKSNYKVSLSGVVLKLRLSSERAFLLRYSINGGSFNDIGSFYTVAATAGNGALQSAINLSNITDLQDVQPSTTVEFRLYYSGSNNSSGSTALGRSSTATEYALSVTGNVEPVTVPSSILAWQFASPQSAGNEISINASVGNAGLETASLTRGAGLRTTSNVGDAIIYPGAFVANAVTASVATSAADINDAITNNTYFAFQVKPSANYKASLSILRAKVRASGGGAKTWLWRYSTDNINFTNLGVAYYNPGTITGGVNMPELDLSAIAALQNIASSTTIYFRLYVQGSNATTGSTGLGISGDTNGYALSLDGTVESTLPVKLTKFTGENSGRNVRLNWATASERQNAYFEVLRLQKDKPSLSLGKVLGNGNSDVTNTYNFTDYNPQSGTNYYQLRQVDQNGDFELSQIIPVKVSLSSSELAAYFKGEVLNLSFDAENAGTVNVKVVDISGRSVYNANTRVQAGKNDLQVPTALSKGVYVILLNGNDISISKKIIK